MYILSFKFYISVAIQQTWKKSQILCNVLTRIRTHGLIPIYSFLSCWADLAPTPTWQAFATLDAILKQLPFGKTRWENQGATFFCHQKNFLSTLQKTFFRSSSVTKNALKMTKILLKISQYWSRIDLGAGKFIFKVIKSKKITIFL
jgi:hypothetical protein